MSKRDRLAWFGAVAFVAVTGLGNLVIWIGQSIEGPSWWGLDAVVLDAAARLVAGEALYVSSPGPMAPPYVYPPLAALLAVPLTFLDEAVAVAIAAIAKVGLAAICVLWLTNGWRTGDRILAFVALVLSLPFLHDLFLGNTNAFIVAAMVPAIFGGPHRRNGILLGLAAAAFAKPLIVPVLLWLAIWRRPAFVGAAATALAATLVSVALLGVDPLFDWVAAVREAATWLSGAFAGNHGVTALLPEAWPPVALITGVGLLLVLWRRGPRVSLAWAVTAGILLAPYAGTYAALPIALALPAIGPLAPTLALAIVATSPIGTTIPLPLFAAAILVAVLALREPVVRVRADAQVALRS
jgi:alpha-1,2-mannosyltransferase